MTQGDQEQLLLVIESRANNGGLEAAEKKVVAAAQTVAAANARAAASTGAATEASRAANAQIDEGIRLLSLKARAVDATSATEVAEIRAAIAAEREHLESVKATGEQYLKLEIIQKGLESRANAAASAAQRTNTAVAGLDPSKVKMGAQAMSSLAFAAQDAALGGKSATYAMGNLAQSLALVGTNARFAMWASGIGAFVTIAATAVSIFEQMNQEAKATDAFMERINSYGLRQAEMMREVTRRRLEAARAAETADYSNRAPDQEAYAREQARKQRERLEDEFGKLNDKAVKLRTEQNRADVARNRALDYTLRVQLRQAENEQQLLELQYKQVAPRSIMLRQLADERDAREAAIRHSLEQYDIENRLVPLTQEQEASKRRLLALEEERFKVLTTILWREDALKQAAYDRQTRRDSTNSEEAYQARLEQIQAEYEAAIAAGVNREAAERRRIAEIKKLERERFDAGVQGYARLSKAAEGHSKVLAAASNFAAAAVRKYEILVQARKDAVMAKSEWAAATKAFANRDFPGGALHLTAAAGYAAAAAAGGLEAGAGSGGGGGGGGAGSLNDSTFTPNSDGRGGPIILQVVTRDAYGRESIQEAVYELQQSGDLRRTVSVAPTPGLRVAQVS